MQLVRDNQRLMLQWKLAQLENLLDMLQNVNTTKALAIQQLKFQVVKTKSLLDSIPHY